MPILSVNLVYQFEWVQIKPYEMVNYRNRVKIDVLMYLNAQLLQAALGNQSMVLPTPKISSKVLMYISK